MPTTPSWLSSGVLTMVYFHNVDSCANACTAAHLALVPIVFYKCMRNAWIKRHLGSITTTAPAHYPTVRKKAPVIPPSPSLYPALLLWLLSSISLIYIPALIYIYIYRGLRPVQQNNFGRHCRKIPPLQCLHARTNLDACEEERWLSSDAGTH